MKTATTRIRQAMTATPIWPANPFPNYHRKAETDMVLIARQVFSPARYMRLFFLAFPIWNALRSELSWTHYRTLMRIELIREQRWLEEQPAAPTGQSTKKKKVKRAR